MPPKKENSKKVAGNAKKAAAAEAKSEKVNAVKARQEDEEWADGAKSTAKKEAAEAKKREVAAKKAEREAELAAEESQVKTVKANPKAGKKKDTTTAAAPLRSIDSAFSAFDNDDEAGPSTSKAALNASGIDNALDALSLTSAQAPGFERHPERRFKAAYAAYEERRLAEGNADGEFAGLRQNQKQQRIRKEFEKSEENPFNQSGIVGFDADKDTIKATREREREMMETRLTGGARK